MRNRMLNPELFKDEALAALPLGATLLFEGLWCLAEDSGCLEDRARVIRSEVFGVRDDITVADVAGWLDALVECGKVERYEVDGRSYLCIVKFLRHQRFKYLPKVSIPIPPWLAAQLAGDVPEDSTPSLDVAAESPEDSGTFQKTPERSTLARARGSEAKRSEAKEKRREVKRSEAQGAPAEPAHPPPLAGCVELFASVAGRPATAAEQGQLRDWLAGQLAKAPPPRDLAAFSWAVARGVNEAETNLIAFAATVAVSAPEHPPPQGWNRWNVQQQRSGAGHEQEPRTVPRNGTGPARPGREVRPAVDVADAWERELGESALPDLPRSGLGMEARAGP